jgi:hypothetical protein
MLHHQDFHTTAYSVNVCRHSAFVSTRILLSLLDKGSVKCIHPFVARQGLSKGVPSVTNTRNIRGIVGRAIFYADCVLSK